MTESKLWLLRDARQAKRQGGEAIPFKPAGKAP